MMSPRAVMPPSTERCNIGSHRNNAFPTLFRHASLLMLALGLIAIRYSAARTFAPARLLRDLSAFAGLKPQRTQNRTAHAGFLWLYEPADSAANPC